MLCYFIPSSNFVCVCGGEGIFQSHFTIFITTFNFKFEQYNVTRSWDIQNLKTNRLNTSNKIRIYIDNIHIL